MNDKRTQKTQNQGLSGTAVLITFSTAATYFPAPQFLNHLSLQRKINCTHAAPGKQRLDQKIFLDP
jgi:hypothetical protein